jgi:hypothetical protein
MGVAASRGSPIPNSWPNFPSLTGRGRSALGVAKLAVLRDGHVLKQGVFASEHEVRHER